MAKGGYRPGAGRKKGLTFAEMVSPAEKRKFVEFILDQYMGDMRLATWMGDHLFVKPVQQIDHTTGGEKLPTPILATLNVQGDHSTTQNTEAQ